MRCLRLVLLLLAASVGADEADFASAPPVPIAGFAEWRFLSGELGASPVGFGYRLYVNPIRPALYSVMRYRFRGETEGRADTEKFLWVEHPGRNVPMRCFERSATGPEATRAWREMAPGTPEYDREMRNVMTVLARQNQESKNPPTGETKR